MGYLSPRFCVIICLNAAMLLLATVLNAQEKVSDLKARISSLEKQLQELQQRHAQQLKALQEQIDKLRQEFQQKQPAAAPGLSPVKSRQALIEELRRAAASEARAEEPEVSPQEEFAKKSAQTTFELGGLSLQALNPEISITGDMVTFYRHNNEVREYFHFNFRNLGIHFQSYLDPYSRFKAAVEVTPHGTELGEAYFTRFGVFKGVNVTLGKFRQQFGVVNRWHKHGLDQVDFPLALRMIFGEGGLNQTGVSIDWTLPAFAGISHELIVQITNGENERLFSGNTLSNPSLLVHYKDFYELSKDTYVEFGVSGLWGWKDEWEVQHQGVLEKESDARSTIVLGADFTLLWEPTQRMRYHNIVWRTEGYFVRRDLLAPDGSGTDRVYAWGMYTYVQAKVARQWEIGVRGDFFEPDTKDYAAVPGASLAPLVSTEPAYYWQVGPYVTWSQSPFVKFRLEYNHLQGHNAGAPEDLLMFQIIFAAGPHKHERY